MNKKGMEMTLGTVITAVLLLVVLGVILYIFVKGMGNGDSAIDSYFDRIDKADGDENDPTIDPSAILGDDWDSEYMFPLVGLCLFKRKKRC